MDIATVLIEGTGATSCPFAFLEVPLAITSFTGDYRWLSNFWPSPVKLDDIEYKTVEHAYQAAKFLDPVRRSLIQAVATPKEAKKLGKLKKGTVLRSDWDNVRVSVMRDLLKQKFTEGSELGQKLLDTKNKELVEGNWWGDTFWGKCNGIGENWLGTLLMEIRKELWQSSPSTGTTP